MGRSKTGTSSDSAILDPRALEIFLSVCHLGGVTAAAKSLGLTQPAVSHALSRLEAMLGVKLIDRQLRPLRMTPAGELLEQHGKEFLAGARRLTAAVRETSRARLPAVRAGLIDSFAATAGPELIRALGAHAEHLRVWSGIASSIAGDFLNRKLDFLVSSDPLDDEPGIERHFLMREPFLLIVPKRLAQSHPKLRVEAVATLLPFIRFSLRSRIGAEAERYLQRLQIRPRHGLEFDATESVFAMVAGGLGWAVTTPLCLRQGRAYGDQLSVLPLASSPPSRSLYLVARAGELPKIVRIATEASRKTLARMLQSELPWVSSTLRRDIIIGSDAA